MNSDERPKFLTDPDMQKVIHKFEKHFPEYPDLVKVR
jgi:hypothetical protein